MSIKLEDFINYHAEITLASESKPRKQLVFRIDAIENGNGNIDLKANYLVRNRFIGIVHVGDFLKPAIKAFNKL